MLKRIAAWLTCAVCLAFFAGPALAGDNAYYVSVNGLLATQNLDEQQTRDKFTGPIEIDFDDSWGVQLRGGYMASKLLSFEAVFEYISPFEAIGGPNSDELDVKNFTVNTKVTCPNFDQVIPYAVAGAGVMNAHEDIQYNGVTSETSDWGLGLRGGLGVDGYINDELSVGIEGAFVMGTGKVDHIRYSTFSVGIAYHF